MTDTEGVILALRSGVMSVDEARDALALERLNGMAEFFSAVDLYGGEPTIRPALHCCSYCKAQAGPGRCQTCGAPR